MLADNASRLAAADILDIRTGGADAAAPSGWSWTPDPIERDQLDGEFLSSFLGFREQGWIFDEPAEPEAAPRPATEGAGTGAGTATDDAGSERPVPAITDPEEGYDIDLAFRGRWDAASKEAVRAAAEAIEGIVVGDLPDAAAGGRAVDDLRLTVSLTEIDGSGGVLAKAGPSSLRVDSGLPAEGFLRFDAADAARLQAKGIWDELALHEMLHTLGVGTLWEDRGEDRGETLLATVGGALRFTGAEATRAYAETFPEIAAKDPLSAEGVPVETDGGPGTAREHWDEAAFGDEIMTGYVDDGAEVSDLTIASLSDLGYETTWDDTPIA